MKYLAALIAIVVSAGCGSSSTAPSSPPAATLQSVALSAPLSALQKKGDTAQVTATGTLSNGTTQNVTSSCVNWASDNTGVLTISGSGLMTAQGSGVSTITTSCQTVAARGVATLNLIPDCCFTRSGTGDTVFDIPTYVARIHIQANYDGNCQNFVVKIAGNLIVNEILGSCGVASGRTFDGTYLINRGGTAEITNSSGVAWTFTEVR